MWRTVDYEQRPAKRGAPSQKKQLSLATGKHGSSSLSRPPKHTEPHTTSSLSSSSAAAPKSVKRLAHDLRRTAKAIRTSCVMKRTLHIDRVEAFLRSRLSAVKSVCSTVTDDSVAYMASPPPQVHLVGLGIGLFDRRESRASFVQMAIFVALRDLCEEVVQSVLTTSVSGGDAVLRTSFFEPLAMEAHRACCAELNIEVETRNVRGAYSPARPHDVLLLFMPHCPWVLLHNTFASNWPGKQHADNGSGNRLGQQQQQQQQPRQTVPSLPLALRRVLWISNDVTNPPMASPHGRLCFESEAVLSCLGVHAVEKARGGHGRGLDRESAAEESDAADSRGLSIRDVCEALSDSALFAISDAVTDEEVRERFNSAWQRSPGIIKASPELL